MNAFINSDYLALFANKILLLTRKSDNQAFIKKHNLINANTNMLTNVKSILSPIIDSYKYYVITDKVKVNPSEISSAENVKWSKCFQISIRNYTNYKSSIVDDIIKSLNKINSHGTNEYAQRVLKHKSELCKSHDDSRPYKSFDLAIVSSKNIPSKTQQNCKNIIWLRNCNVEINTFEIDDETQTSYTFTFSEDDIDTSGFIDFIDMHDSIAFEIVSNLYSLLKGEYNYFDYFLLGTEHYMENMINSNISNDICQKLFSKINNSKYSFFMHNLLKNCIPYLNELFKNKHYIDSAPLKNNGVPITTPSKGQFVYGNKQEVKSARSSINNKHGAYIVKSQKETTNINTSREKHMVHNDLSENHYVACCDTENSSSSNNSLSEDNISQQNDNVKLIAKSEIDALNKDIQLKNELIETLKLKISTFENNSGELIIKNDKLLETVAKLQFELENLKIDYKIIKSEKDMLFVKCIKLSDELEQINSQYYKYD